MKTFLNITCLCIVFSAAGQSVGSLNLNYIYNPLNEVDFQFKLIKEVNQMRVFYLLYPRQASATVQDYTIAWEQRESFNQREGTPLTPNETTIKTASDRKAAWLSFPVPEKPWLLVAKIKNIKTSTSWVYVKTIEAKYPVNGYLISGEEIVTPPYFPQEKEVTVMGTDSNKTIYGYYYKEDFLPASPPYVESESRVDRFLTYDSTFRITSGSKILSKKEGLYLFQDDTTAATGFASRCVRNAFPKYTHVEDLIKPMIYVCTLEENQQLKAAQGDKLKFDKVILSITGNTDRAKNFIRNYFRRVELANQYFSSYKEGWKTDRGMIYIIFGMPNEILYNGEAEVWRYKSMDLTFTFVKTGSVYGPEYFVLVRDKQFAEAWFTTIDLWRKSRF